MVAQQAVAQMQHRAPGVSATALGGAAAYSAPNGSGPLSMTGVAMGTRLPPAPSMPPTASYVVTGVTSASTAPTMAAGSTGMVVTGSVPGMSMGMGMGMGMGMPTSGATSMSMGMGTGPAYADTPAGRLPDRADLQARIA